LWKLHQERWERHRKAGITDPRLADFRWLIEELRVSLFAQELNTPLPVSVKRLEKLWESVA
jgi:ATP-dependent helicase HrpA